jgi:hypothetical protein
MLILRGYFLWILLEDGQSEDKLEKRSRIPPRFGGNSMVSTRQWGKFQ